MTGSTRRLILGVMGDGRLWSHRDVVRETGLSDSAVWNGLRRCWEWGDVLRTKSVICAPGKVFKGRAGTSRNTRPYHLYVLRPEDQDSLFFDGLEFVAFSEEYLDPRGGGSKSKAQRILDFLRDHSDRAWFSTEIVEALKEHGVRRSDIMTNVRRFERKRLVYVRGYRSHSRQTPFKEGYLITWIDQAKPREHALEEAIKRTSEALEQRSTTNPFIQKSTPNQGCDL